MSAILAHPRAVLGSVFASASLVTPRAVSGVLSANSDPKAMLGELKAAFDEFKVKNDGKVSSLEKNVQAALDDIAAKMAAASLGGAGLGDTMSGSFDVNAALNDRVDPEYTKLFASFVRHGERSQDLHAANREGKRQQIQAAMSAGSASDGGYLAPIEWDRKVLKKLIAISPMRKLADIVVTGVRGYSTVWNGGGWGSGWVGETAARPGTASPTLSPLTFTSGELYAMPAITAQLLDDADFNVDEWFSTELADEFAKQESIAFISGDGVNKPQGLLTYATGGTAAAVHPGGAIAIVNSGNASALTADGLIDFAFSLPVQYRQGATWLMSSTTAAAIRKMKDAGNNYIWQVNYDKGAPDQLLGYPVEIDDNMPTIAAGALPVAFGNFKRGYVINDRQGVRILRDPFTNKPYVNFYTTKRVGGGLRDPNAFRILKVSA